MSDTSGAFPPPPPAGAPPPAYHQAPTGVADYTYQPPPMAQPPAGYPQQWRGQPWQQPQAPTGAGIGWGLVGIMAQFEPPAMWSILVGGATVAAPFLVGIYFLWLPVVGAVMGFRAIAGGQLIGGLVGIGLSVIGGLLTIGLFIARVHQAAG